MIDERARRRASYQEGTLVRLADGQLWSLPALSGEEGDPVLEALLSAVNMPESDPERLRDELALTIALLSRNYHLSPEAYPQILSFRPEDPAKIELLETIRSLARGASQSPRAVPLPNIDRAPRPSRRWGLFANRASSSRARSRWSFRSR